MLRTGSRSRNHHSCSNQESTCQEEKSPNLWVGTAEGSRREWLSWDSFLSPKALASTSRTITEQEKEEETLPVASHRNGDGNLIRAEQSSGSCSPPASAPQYLQLSAKDAVLVPKTHLQELLLGGRTTQSLAGSPTEPGAPTCRSSAPAPPAPC